MNNMKGEIAPFHSRGIVMSYGKNYINILLLVISTIICLLVVFLFYLVKAKNFYDMHTQLFLSSSFIQDDPLAGFSQKPNLNIQFGFKNTRFNLFTDDIGARVDQPGKISPKRVDILGIGCSFTWGDYIEYKYSYLNLLAKNTGLIVSNVAVPSYGTTTAFLSLEKNRYLHPRIVIYAFIEDHIKRNLTPCAPCFSPFCRPNPFVDFKPDLQPYIHDPLPYSQRNIFRYFEDIIAEHRFGLKDIYWAFKKELLFLTKKDSMSLNAKFQHNYSDPSRRQEALRYLIEKMNILCNELQAKLVIVYIPTPADVRPPPEELTNVMKRYMNNRNIFYVDLTRPFYEYAQKYRESKLMAMGGNDPHPSQQAHQLIANELYSLIVNILSDKR